MSTHHGDSVTRETLLMVLSFKSLSKLGDRRLCLKDVGLIAGPRLLQRHTDLLQLTATENLWVLDNILNLFGKILLADRKGAEYEGPIPSAITPGTPERESQA
jgi:hypothetical protein